MKQMIARKMVSVKAIEGRTNMFSGEGEIFVYCKGGTK
jgi:hypothetical protein